MHNGFCNYAPFGCGHLCVVSDAVVVVAVEATIGRPPATRARSDEIESVRAASSVDSPPPCGEGLGVGVVQCGDAAPNRATPLPSPPPQGGREQTECVAPLCINLIGKRSNLSCRTYLKALEVLEQLGPRDSSETFLRSSALPTERALPDLHGPQGRLPLRNASGSRAGARPALPDCPARRDRRATTRRRRGRGPAGQTNRRQVGLRVVNCLDEPR